MDTVNRHISGKLTNILSEYEKEEKEDMREKELEWTNNKKETEERVEKKMKEKE